MLDPKKNICPKLVAVLSPQDAKAEGIPLPEGATEARVYRGPLPAPPDDPVSTNPLPIPWPAYKACSALEAVLPPLPAMRRRISKVIVSGEASEVQVLMDDGSILEGLATIEVSSGGSHPGFVLTGNL